MQDNKLQIQETQRTLSWRKKKIMQALHGQIAKNQEKDKILKVAGRKKKKKNTHFVIVLICISLMTQDMKHLFICLFAICVSSLVRCLFRSWAHFNQHFLIFNIEFYEYFLYFRNSHLSNVSFMNIFSQNVACLLILLILSYT